MTRKDKAGIRAQDGVAANNYVDVSLLGAFVLRSGGATQRLPKKAQALLAYLAIHQDQAISRDRLCTLLWGKTATEQARSSLRQCLVALRSAFGPIANTLIVADTVSVMLRSSNCLIVDAVDFKAACGSSVLADLERANELYRNELLAGLDIPVDDYNEWVSLERQRFSSLRADLLLRLSGGRESAGDIPGATEAARELTSHDPIREQGHRVLMRLLVLSGQRNAALQQYEKLVSLLQEQLGIAPESETVSLADKIRSGHELDKAWQVAPSHTAARFPNQLPDRVADLSHPIITSSPAVPDRPSIVVLPFTNLSGDPSQNYFVDGLVEDITIALGREKWLFVIASQTAFTFRNRDADPREISAKLDIRYVLRGSFRKSADRVRVVVLLTDAASGEFMWADRFEDDADNVFDLNDRLVTRLAASIAPALRSIEIERVRRQPPANLSAFELYLQAVPGLRADLAENQRALKLLEQAIALDPSYSVAYALAARCYQFQRLMGWVPLNGEARERGAGFARLAIDLGKNDSEAMWMAAHAITQFTGEIEVAHDLIDRSLKLNPNSTSAWSSSCYLQTLLGDFERAIDHFHVSQRLNPLDRLHHVHWNIVGMAYFGAGQYQSADAAADKALGVQPTYPQALRLKIAACGALGKSEQGQANVQRLLAVHPECSLAWLEDFHRPMMIRTPELLKSYVAAAQKGGMPEVSMRAKDGNFTVQ